MHSVPVAFPWCLWPYHTYLVPHRSPGNPDSSSQGWHRSCHSDSCWMSSHSSDLCSFLLKIMNKLEAANHKIPKHAPTKVPRAKTPSWRVAHSCSLETRQFHKEKQWFLEWGKTNVPSTVWGKEAPSQESLLLQMHLATGKTVHTPLSSD